VGGGVFRAPDGMGATWVRPWRAVTRRHSTPLCDSQGSGNRPARSEAAQHFLGTRKVCASSENGSGEKKRSLMKFRRQGGPCLSTRQRAGNG
jgi:hypothetical protein